MVTSRLARPRQARPLARSSTTAASRASSPSSMAPSSAAPRSTHPMPAAVRRPWSDLTPWPEVRSGRRRSQPPRPRRGPRARRRMRAPRSAAGATALGLHSSQSMRAAVRLYERMGFVRDPDHDFQPPGAELVEGYLLRLDDAATHIRSPDRCPFVQSARARRSRFSSACSRSPHLPSLVRAQQGTASSATSSTRATISESRSSRSSSPAGSRAFDPATGRGTLQWDRYTLGAGHSFEKTDVVYSRAQATEFPGTEYDRDPALPFEISFVTPAHAAPAPQHARPARGDDAGRTVADARRPGADGSLVARGERRQRGHVHERVRKGRDPS